MAIQRNIVFFRFR